ncbi:MAG: 16S rRNA (uracil(1498)-N(3))-methyltransferase [Candidatus Delongbacteria bacterium]|nr:16S rRNA (uracil(1498)-N(3))-methyltransferase [Candidatus Delongbacteria bacterium]
MKTQSLPLFFSPSPLISDSRIELSVEETRHLYQSRRITPGYSIELINGKGVRSEGTFVGLTNGRQAVIHIGPCHTIERSLPRVECFFPIIRLPRLEIALEKLTELGIDAIHFYHGTYSIPFSDRAFRQKSDRWQALMAAAMKQSRQPYQPEITYSSSLENAISLCRSEFRLVPLETRSGTSLVYHVETALTHDNLACIIGAEGGFSPDEIEWMTSHQCRFASLGHSILRTETAAILTAGLLKTLVRKENSLCQN